MIDNEQDKFDNDEQINAQTNKPRKLFNNYEQYESRYSSL